LDWAALCGQMRRQIILDGRNALEGVTWPETARYIRIGRAIGNRKNAKARSVASEGTE
jgi:hypothetical protein